MTFAGVICTISKPLLVYFKRHALGQLTEPYGVKLARQILRDSTTASPPSGALVNRPT
jgi:hypothetical protein